MLEEFQRGADAILVHLGEGFVEGDEPDRGAAVALIDAVQLDERRRDGEVEGCLCLTTGGVADDLAEARGAPVGVRDLYVIAQIVPIVGQLRLRNAFPIGMRRARQRFIEAIERFFVSRIKFAFEQRAGAQDLRVVDQIVELTDILRGVVTETVAFVVEYELVQRIVDTLQLAPRREDVLA